MSIYPKVEKPNVPFAKDQRLSQKTLNFLSTALIGSGLVLGIAATPAEAKIVTPTISIERRAGSVIVLTPASSSKSAKTFLTGHGSHASHASHASHFSHYSGR